MNSKTFSNFFVKSFLFGLTLLCLVGIASTNANAQKLTIKKDFCTSINLATNTCNNNLKFDPNKDGSAGTVFFTITPVVEGGTTSTVRVVINDEGNSSGTLALIPLTKNTTFIVCEMVPEGFKSTPRPDLTTGGGSQSVPPSMPNCIQFTTTNSEATFNLQFLNTAVTTAATAKVSGRIRDINGKPATRVSVTITNVSTGEMFATRTDLFGRYAFTELATGEDYLLRVFSKRNVFKVNEMFINLLEDFTDANFTADSGRANSAGRQ